MIDIITIEQEKAIKSLERAFKKCAKLGISFAELIFFQPSVNHINSATNVIAGRILLSTFASLSNKIASVVACSIASG